MTLDIYLILVCCIIPPPPNKIFKFKISNISFYIAATKDWVNEPRQRIVCDSYLESVTNINHYPIQDKFSVMISTYNPERIEHLSLIIQHLLQSEKVHTVFITWHNPALEIPASLYQGINESDYERVKVLGQTFDSLNNRFNPVDELQTDAVYIMDDDIYVDLKDLEFTFSVSLIYHICLHDLY